MYGTAAPLRHLLDEEESCLDQMTYRAVGGQVLLRASSTEVKAMPVAKGRTLALVMSAMPASLRASRIIKLVTLASKEEPAACIWSLSAFVKNPLCLQSNSQANKEACDDFFKFNIANEPGAKYSLPLAGQLQYHQISQCHVPYCNVVCAPADKQPWLPSPRPQFYLGNCCYPSLQPPARYELALI